MSSKHNILVSMEEGVEAPLWLSKIEPFIQDVLESLNVSFWEVSVLFCKDDFIRESSKIHNNKYDYSKVNYVNSQTKVCIICPEHGEFWQTPYDHIWAKNDCPLCAKENVIKKQTKSLSDFIIQARQIHGYKYDYSKVEYKSNKKKVCIIDIESGNEFWQTPLNHLKGFGYNGRNKRNLSKEEYISKAKEIYGDLYDYTNIDY